LEQDSEEEKTVQIVKKGKKNKKEKNKELSENELDDELVSEDVKSYVIVGKEEECPEEIVEIIKPIEPESKTQFVESVQTESKIKEEMSIIEEDKKIRKRPR